MRVRIDIDLGTVPATTLEVTPGVVTAVAGGALDGGAPSAELLAAVGAAAEGGAPSAELLAAVGTGSVTVDGGAPSAELLAAVAAAGGLTTAPSARASVAVSNGLANEILDAGPAPD